MKQWLIIRICILLVVALSAHFAAQIRRVHRLDAGYQQIQRGMDAATVFVTMNENTVEMFQKDGWSKEAGGWWDETPLENREAARIQYAQRYTAHEFFKTIRWVFTYDRNDKVVGKHCFD